MVNISPREVVPALAFFKISADPHELVGNRKNGFRHPLIGGVKTLFFDCPGISLKII
jgi:hypothetical protein